MMMHVIHNSISITQYVTKGLKHISFSAAYALLVNQKVTYPVEPEVFICTRLNLI